MIATLVLLLVQTWSPLERQEVEADTLYLLDVDAEQKLAPGDGGLIPGNATGGSTRLRSPARASDD